MSKQDKTRVLGYIDTEYGPIKITEDNDPDVFKGMPSLSKAEHERRRQAQLKEDFKYAVEVGNRQEKELDLTKKELIVAKNMIFSEKLNQRITPFGPAKISRITEERRDILYRIHFFGSKATYDLTYLNFPGGFSGLKPSGLWNAFLRSLNSEHNENAVERCRINKALQEVFRGYDEFNFFERGGRFKFPVKISRKEQSIVKGGRKPSFHAPEPENEDSNEPENEDFID